MNNFIFLYKITKFIEFFIKISAFFLILYKIKKNSVFFRFLTTLFLSLFQNKFSLVFFSVFFIITRVPLIVKR